MGQDYKALASAIIEGVGGKENINSVIHCITRLRFYLKDETKADTATITDLDGVAGAVYNKQLGQYQVVIGQAVEDVYDEVIAQLGASYAGGSEEDTETTDSAPEAEKPASFIGWIKYAFQLLIGTITGSMIPVIGLLAASGILKGFLTLFTQNLHWIDLESSTFIIINAMGDSAFYFLPILVGFCAAKQLKSDPIVVATIAGVLVHPSIAALWHPIA